MIYTLIPVIVIVTLLLLILGLKHREQSIPLSPTNINTPITRKTEFHATIIRACSNCGAPGQQGINICSACGCTRPSDERPGNNGLIAVKKVFSDGNIGNVRY